MDSSNAECQTTRSPYWQGYHARDVEVEVLRKQNERLRSLSDSFLTMRDRVAGYMSEPPVARQFSDGAYAFEWAAANIRAVAAGDEPLLPPVPLQPFREGDSEADGWKYYVLTCETCGDRFTCSARVPVDHHVLDVDKSVRHYGRPNSKENRR